MALKTIEEIYEEMQLDFEKRTGVEAREGCDLSARMYALAAQIYALQVQADWVCRQSFPQTAQGEYLDHHAQLRALERKQAVAAQGTVRFSASEAIETDRTIAKGTVCMTGGLVRFETIQDVTLPAGARSIDIPVRAVEAGTGGNVAAGTINIMSVAPVGISSCTNPEPCVGGVDEEEDEALRVRVLESFRRLPNGANAAFYEQAALSFDEVAAAAVVSRPRGVGSVDVVVATQAGLPDEALLAELTDYFQQRREIAVDVKVRAPETICVDVTVRIAAQKKTDREIVRQSVTNTLQNWFNGQRLGESILRAKLGDLIYRCDGVENYSILIPEQDILLQADVLPVLGSLCVEELV